METESASGAAGLCNVVIGLDGSDASRAAIDWVARMVPPDGVVHAVHAVPSRDDAARCLTAWTRDAAARGLDVRLVPTQKPPVDALLETAASVDADVIVVGAHATGRHGPRLVGRTVRSLINRADRPVVVVPERASSTAGRANTIVAGIGRDAPSRAALRWATDHAVSHDTPLSLVRAVERRPFFDLDGLLDMIAYYIEPGTVRRWALADVAALADEIQRSTDEELAIAWSAPTGAAGPRLVEAASDASVLVLGRRGVAKASRHLPRSLEHTIKHAPCPIVVVPSDRAADDGLGV